MKLSDAQFKALNKLSYLSCNVWAKSQKERTYNSLVKRGLATQSAGFHPENYEYNITDAGRAALDAAKGGA